MLDIGLCGKEELQEWYAHTSITKAELYSFSPYAKSTIRTYLSGIYKSNDINNDKQSLLQAHYDAIIQEEEKRKRFYRKNTLSTMNPIFFFLIAQQSMRMLIFLKR